MSKANGRKGTAETAAAAAVHEMFTTAGRMRAYNIYARRYDEVLPKYVCAASCLFGVAVGRGRNNCLPGTRSVARSDILFKAGVRRILRVVFFFFKSINAT